MRWLFLTVAVLMLTGCGGSTFELFPDTKTDSSTSAAIPAITSFAPTSGRAGMVVTIEGTNFSTTPASNIVMFNGVTAVVSSATATQITTTVPAGATTGPISVTVGSKAATTATSFTVTVLMGGALQGHPLTLLNSVTTLAGTAGTSGADDGTGSAAGFFSPKGITTDGINLYVADSNNNTIRQIVIASGAVTTLAGSAGASGPDDGTAAARFDFPSGITTDGTNLYVADANNNTIRKIVIASGAVTTLAGTAGAIGFDDGTGSDALFNFPSGITTDGTNLYVVDSGNNTIRKIAIATGAVSTFAGTAEEVGFADGSGAAARFDLPTGITTDGTNLYVDDSNNNTIRKIVIATGVVTTLAGTAGEFGFDDGSGSAAQFDFPNRITTDGTNLYVSDANNSTIRKIVIATGAVSTLAGSAGMPGADDGTGSTALFDFPSGITTDGTNLYVVDENNHTIRKIQ